MNLITSHPQTHALPEYISTAASGKKARFNQSSEGRKKFFHDLSEVPAHALDENDGVPLSSKESRFVWLAIIVGQVILGLTIYAVL
ncbi:hypothetical protein B0I27_1036 [Arcticibacter pallidicorallinus]|uniref:Uncharacterized protein n=1 Tax=Arcticibacter pallidicorallinus TaxID=1259464 RepID=A0A2T0U6N0_9SPHI|nr:hypothetical protein [Arcticibacter pallidicorallinus]PRY53542.1 hypothetical protein B0I27_1036 [Arcticibacter pallidicorallinus]